jgi:uncharacterized RDD family membrane protein YckC
MIFLAGAETGLIFVGLAGALLIGFWIWMLIDCAVYEPNEGNTKATWLIILFVGNWIGALVYLFVRRPQRKAQLGR